MERRMLNELEFAVVSFVRAFGAYDNRCGLAARLADVDPNWIENHLSRSPAYADFWYHFNEAVGVLENQVLSEADYSDSIPSALSTTVLQSRATHVVRLLAVSGYRAEQMSADLLLEDGRQTQATLVVCDPIDSVDLTGANHRPVEGTS